MSSNGSGDCRFSTSWLSGKPKKVWRTEEDGTSPLINSGKLLNSCALVAWIFALFVVGRVSNDAPIECPLQESSSFFRLFLDFIFVDNVAL